MNTDIAKSNSAVKDMKNVIAQLEKKGKGNTGLRPTQTGVKPSLTSSKGTLRMSTSEKDDGSPSPVSASSQSEEPINPFKAALKPVKPPPGKQPNEAEKSVKSNDISKSERNGSESSASSKPKTFEKTTTKVELGVKEESDKDASASSGSLVNRRFKKLETPQKESETDLPNSSSANGSSTYSKPHDKSNILKTTVAPKPASKGGLTRNPSNVASTTEDKITPGYVKPEEAENVHRSQNAQETPKPKNKAFLNELENKTLQRSANTSEPSIISTSGTLTKRIKEPPEISQRANKKEFNEENNEEANEQPKVPSRVSEKSEKPKPRTKMPSVTTEDTDQPKIPPRKEQKVQETNTAEKTVPPKKTATINNHTNEAKQNKIQEKFDQNANKIGAHNLQSLPGNKSRTLPLPTEKKENQKKYRLLPVPKSSGNPPRKPAKPPAIDLSKYAMYAKPKGPVVQPPQSLSSIASFEDGDDLYEDCDNILASQAEHILEYTEEEEAKIEKMAKEKLGHSTDNYGKMFNNNPIDYEDDDDIYQEID